MSSPESKALGGPARKVKYYSDLIRLERTSTNVTSLDFTIKLQIQKIVPTIKDQGVKFLVSCASAGESRAQIRK